MPGINLTLTRAREVRSPRRQRQKILIQEAGLAGNGKKARAEASATP